MSTEPDPREPDRQVSRRIGAWGTLNALRQHFEQTREKTGGKLPEIPFGSSYTVNQGTTAWKWLGPALLAAGAAGGGYLWGTKDTVPPAPVDAVLEWEISDDDASITVEGEEDGER